MKVGNKLLEDEQTMEIFHGSQTAQALKGTT
jgi:hypothetical protein